MFSMRDLNGNWRARFGQGYDMEWVRKVLYSIVSVFNFYFLLQLPRVPP